ncbi:hypothetical protein HMPREF0731_1282 [Pseudoroseomonas cervicalis ATCC 49957]|uniref:Uncharacterized protein n=1 Tax=Pseudoroseomonas cervicalis ATCC 49957 TaxID=525371 RepID=D5RJM2_9PROT|nr:hypothetical protein HMPREF0731_1282 [Pseudoroseomonas cervicalis ATCC 49957]
MAGAARRVTRPRWLAGLWQSGYTLPGALQTRKICAETIRKSDRAWPP